MNYTYSIIDDVSLVDATMAHLETQSCLAVDTETVGLEAKAYWAEFAKVDPNVTYYKEKYDEYRLACSTTHRKDAGYRMIRDEYKTSLQEALRCHRELIRKAKKNPGALDFWRNECASIQIGVDAEDNGGVYQCYLIRPTVLNPTDLEALLNSRRQLLFQNAKFDWKVLRRHLGLELHCRNLYDTRIAEYLINCGRDLPSSLKEIVRRRFGHTMDKTIALSNWSGQWTEEMCTYAAEDVAYLHMIKRAQRDELTALRLYPLFQMECALTPAVGRMEMNGFAVDVEELRTQARGLETEYNVLLERATNILNGANPASPAQVKKALADLGVDAKNTDKKTLKAHQDHEAVQVLQSFKQVQKTLTTYYRPLEERVVNYGHEFRIHANFNTAVTDTGRLSSSEPNLQNQPAGGDVRRVFVAGHGWKLIVGDLSQIEMRILAHVTQDRNLIKSFKEDIDVHTLAASMVFGVPYEDVTKVQRTVVKAIQFGLVYGKTEHGLSQDLGISKRKAESFIKRYFRVYRGVERFIGETREQAHKDGYVRTLGGRVRHLPGLRSSDKWLRAHCERAAVNTVIQGTAADGMKRSLLYLDQALEEVHDDIRLVCNVHDEVIVEARDHDEQFLWMATTLVKDKLIQGTQELIPSVPVKVGSADTGWTCKVVGCWADGK